MRKVLIGLAFVAGAVWDDNADSLAHQEVLLGGTLIQIFLKEKLNEFLVVSACPLCLLCVPLFYPAWLSFRSTLHLIRAFFYITIIHTTIPSI